MLYSGTFDHEDFLQINDSVTTPQKGLRLLWTKEWYLFCIWLLDRATVIYVYLGFGKVSLLFTPLDGAVRVICSHGTSDYLLIILLVLGNNTHQHTKLLTTEKAGKLQWLTQTASFSCFHRLSIVGTLCCLLGQQYWLLMTIMIISISPSYPELFSANYLQGNLTALSLGRYLSWSCLVKYR